MAISGEKKRLLARILAAMRSHRGKLGLGAGLALHVPFDAAVLYAGYRLGSRKRRER